MAIESITISETLVIPPDELQWRFSASGGPGGQHVNTSNTRVELFWDIETSKVLGDAERALLADRLGSTVRVVVSDARSQLRNRELAMDRLADRVRSALHVQAVRRPSRPRKAAVERRLEEKSVQSKRKQSRREVGYESE